MKRYTRPAAATLLTVIAALVIGACGQLVELIELIIFVGRGIERQLELFRRQGGTSTW